MQPGLRKTAFRTGTGVENYRRMFIPMSSILLFGVQALTQAFSVATQRRALKTTSACTSPWASAPSSRPTRPCRPPRCSATSRHALPATRNAHGSSLLQVSCEAFPSARMASVTFAVASAWLVDCATTNAESDRVGMVSRRPAVHEDRWWGATPMRILGHSAC